MASVSPNKLQTWLTSLGRRRKEVGIGLLILWSTFGIAGGYLTYKHDSWPNLSWGEIVGLYFGCAAGLWGGLWCLTNFSFNTNDEDHGRITVAIVGTFVALGLLVLSAVRTYEDWKQYIGPGLEAWQGKGGWHVWVCLFSAVGGLAVLFLTLTLVRSDEYSNRYVRLISYGYIAVQSCLMLLGVIVFVNVIVFFLFPTPADWTASGLYTLNERSVAILRSLKQPVKIYYLTADLGAADADAKLLLSNCQAVTDKVQTEIVLRDRNIKRMEELRTKSLLPLDSAGLLVTYESPDGKSDYQFIRLDELYDPPENRGERPRFKGENALITVIDYLTEGKVKATVYFTQDNGELDITNTTGLRPEQRGSALAERLRKTNYEVKGLILAAPIGEADASGAIVRSLKVPDDASVVVIAGPTQKFSDSAVAALRTYMTTPNAKKKKGRLVVLADAIPDPKAKGKMLSTGLEGLMAEFSVDLSGFRILSASTRSQNPVNVGVTGSSSSNNPMAEVLNRVLLPMANVRVVRQGNPNLRGAAPLQTEEFLVAVQTQSSLLFTSDDLTGDGSEFLDLVRERNKEAIEKFNKQRSRTPVPAGVAVSEASDENGPDPTNQHAKSGETTPRLVVIGNSRFVSDDVISDSGDQATYSFAVVSSSLAWLREKPASIGIPPADRKSYQMKADTHVDRMVWLPLGLMIFTICGLGTAMWLVRRR